MDVESICSEYHRALMDLGHQSFLSLQYDLFGLQVLRVRMVQPAQSFL